MHTHAHHEGLQRHSREKVRPARGIQWLSREKVRPARGIQWLSREKARPARGIQWLSREKARPMRLKTAFSAILGSQGELFRARSHARPSRANFFAHSTRRRGDFETGNTLVKSCGVV